MTVITGATSGIGLATAHALGRLRHPLVLVGRDPVRLARAIDEVRGTGAPLVDGRLADLTRMQEVAGLARGISADHPRVGVLVNNAGALFMRREETGEGVERTFALNVLAPYLLTRALAPVLAAAGPARVVNVASAAHRSARLRLDDLEGHRRFGGWSAYGRSKLALILLTREFARRHPSGSITFNCCHPGFVRTRYAQNNRGLIGPMVRFLAAVGGIPATRGAEVVVWLASSLDVAAATGLYFDRTGPRLASARARDPAAATALYAALDRRLRELGIALAETPAPGERGP